MAKNFENCVCQHCFMKTAPVSTGMLPCLRVSTAACCVQVSVWMVKIIWGHVGRAQEVTGRVLSDAGRADTRLAF